MQLQSDMLDGVLDAMSNDMSHKLRGHFNSLEAHFRPVEAHVKHLKEEQAYLHAASRHAESFRTSTYAESRDATRLAHRNRIQGVYNMVPWSEVKKSTKHKHLNRPT
jgi:hypothetical protein